MQVKVTQGELKNPFENKNKTIRSKGPTPKTKRTIFAVRGVAFCSAVSFTMLDTIFFLDLLRDMLNNKHIIPIVIHKG